MNEIQKFTIEEQKAEIHKKILVLRMASPIRCGGAQYINNVYHLMIGGKYITLEELNEIKVKKIAENKIKIEELEKQLQEL